MFHVKVNNSPFSKMLQSTVSIKELLWASVNGRFNALLSLMLLSVIMKSGNDSFMLLSYFLNRVLVSFLVTSLKHVESLLDSVAITLALISIVEFLKKVWSNFVSNLFVLLL